MLYWGANHWPAFDTRSAKPLAADKAWPRMPWGDHGRYGDGCLLYPGPDGPFTSMRLEIIRDGVEDHDALHMLADLLKKKGDGVPVALVDRARQALSLSPDIFQSMSKLPADAAVMVTRRRTVNELIVLLAKASSQQVKSRPRLSADESPVTVCDRQARGSTMGSSLLNL